MKLLIYSVIASLQVLCFTLVLRTGETDFKLGLRRRLSFFDPKSVEEKTDQVPPSPLFSQQDPLKQQQYLIPKVQERLPQVVPPPQNQALSHQQESLQNFPPEATQLLRSNDFTESGNLQESQSKIEQGTLSQLKQGTVSQTEQGPSSQTEQDQKSQPLHQRKGDGPSEPLHKRKGDVPQEFPSPNSSQLESTRNPNEASHIQLCRELVRRTELKGKEFENFVVHESPLVCSAQESYISLAHMMVSAIIAQAGSKVRLSYQHGCMVEENTMGAATIQQFLPHDLTVGVGIGQFPIAESCSKCLAALHSGRDFVECMGIAPVGEPLEHIDPMTMSLRVAGFRHNIQQAVMEMRRIEIKNGISYPTYGGAVIVLDLEAETSGQTWALPLYYYQDIIPASVSSIAVLVSQRCIDANPLCQSHGQFLARGLGGLYPDAQIYGEILTSTSMAYSRILDAPHLICSTSMFCLIPSLVGEYSQSSYIVTRNNLFEWFKYVARENRKLMGKNLQVLDENDISKIAVRDSNKVANFLKQSRPKVRRLSMVSDPKTVVVKRRLTQAPHEGLHGNDFDAIDTYHAHSGYTLDPNIPSYVHLCRELLDRKQHMGLADLFTVHESPEVCDSPDSFYALSTIMIASVIAHAGSLFRLSYDHNCGLPSDIKKTMIQQLLPVTLTLSLRIGINQAMEKCSACTSGDVTNFRNMIECFGFPVPGPMASDPVDAAKYIPHFRHNIEKAVDRARLIEAGDRPPANAGVVIYVGTDVETGGALYQVPFRHYAEIIPRDVSSISIVAAESCSNYGDLLALTKQYLHSMYPTTDIHVESVSGTAIAYARMMEAPLTICSPSLFCVLPSLFKEYAHSSHLIAHDGMHPWFPFLAKEVGAKLNNSIFLHDDQPVTAARPLHEMRTFLFESLHPGSKACVDLRGRIGEWIQDFNYAKTAQYVTPLKRFQKFNFTPSPEAPFRVATSFRWTDALCPIATVDLDGLCSSLQKNGLTRIYFVGDSLALQMAQSLWKLLGHDDDPYKPATMKGALFQWSRDVQCQNSPGFEIMYTRNDLLDNNDEKDLHLRTGNRDFNCGYAEFCMPWIRNFSEYKKGGTLLIANVGTHVHDLDLYRKYLSDFFALVDGNYASKNLVMFRTTVAGHENCQNPNVAPLRSYDEYLEKHFIADFKSYHLFPTFNRMAEEQIRRHEGKNLLILDVVPMTILRPDGHTSGPQRCSTCKDNDCLHYMLPGPTDWWNHLMYSNLVNFGTAIER